MRTIRQQLWIGYKKKCSLCGRFMKLCDVTIDHIIPKSKGGVNHISNYAPAHKRCNSLKGSQLREHFKLRLINLKQSGLKTGRRAEYRKLGKISLEERWMFLFGEPLPEKYKLSTSKV